MNNNRYDWSDIKPYLEFLGCVAVVMLFFLYALYHG